MKKCKVCGEECQLVAFPLKRTVIRKDGSSHQKRGTTCRRCSKSKARKQRRCVDCNKPVIDGQRRCEFHRKKRAEYANRTYAIARRAVLDHFGSRCAYCGEEREFFLTVDHVNDDGVEHRKEVGGGRLYRWLVAENFPPGFQILCYNCNGAKAKMGEATLLKALREHATTSCLTTPSVY